MLNLPDTLRCDPEFVANLPERMQLTIPHPRPHSENVRRPVLQLGKLALSKAVQGRKWKLVGGGHLR